MTALDARVIRVLPPDVASSIAAGEVVERPVSVVRELLDNAIDAGSTRISVAIEDGGVGLIQVIDDGRGIAPEEVELAFERHATSKINAISDIAEVRTLGFRGEALPAIASAGDVHLVTRAIEQPVAVQLTVVNGAIARRVSRAAPPGTSMSVRELFGRVPARRKFLGSAAAEARRISVLVSHYALAYPGIAFQLTLNRRRSLTTSGAGGIRGAFASVYGAEAADTMLDVNHEADGVCVSGLAGPPSLHRGNRSGISVFINGRWVQSRSLGFAVSDAFANELPGGRFPVAAIAVSLPGSEVDVNVHPAKAEVRFRDERSVGRTIRRGITGALESAGPAMWSSPAIGPPASGPTLRERLEAGPALSREPGGSQLDLSWRQEPMPAAVDADTGAGQPLAMPSQREVLPLLRVVGQMGLTYIVAEGPDGMYLIDQHAAHERVLYDRLQAAPGREAIEQPLMEPLTIDLEPELAMVFEDHRPHLEGLGLVCESFGERTYLIRSVPHALVGKDAVEALRSLLGQLAKERRVADPFGRAAATVACHGSVRAGMAMAMEEMRKLIEDLEVTTAPRTCPHGRPTVVHVKTELLERQFGRR